MRAAAVVLLAGLALLSGAALNARRAAARERAVGPDEERAAVETIRSVLTLATHLRGSGGDPRFAERIPAAPPVIDELQRELEFTQHLGFVEERQLVKFEVGRVQRPGPGLVEVDTRESWVTRKVYEEGARPGEGPRPEARSDVVYTRWVVARRPGGWMVVDWTLAPAADPRERAGS